MRLLTSAKIWLKNLDPTYMHRLLLYKSVYIFIIIFIANSLIKPNYSAFFFLIAFFAVVTPESFVFESFKQKDYAIINYYFLAAFIVFGLSLLWSHILLACLFIFVSYVGFMGYAVFWRPHLKIIVTQGMLVGIMSVKSYYSGDIFQIINQILDISCATIIVFWALKFYPNRYDIRWRMLWARFFEKIIPRLHKQSDNYMELVNLRYDVLKLNSLILYKPKPLHYFRFNKECYAYHNFIEKLRIEEPSRDELLVIENDILALTVALDENCQCQLQFLNKRSEIIENHRQIFDKLVYNWNALC